MLNPVSTIKLLEGPRVSRPRGTATAPPAASLDASAQPVAAVSGVAFRKQNTIFLAQLLAADVPYQGVELDGTAQSLALYKRAAGYSLQAQGPANLTA